MKMISGHDDAFAEWVLLKHGFDCRQNFCHLFGVIDNEGTLCGVIQLIPRNLTTVELGVYGAVSPDVVKTTFNMIFDHWHRLEVRFGRDNKRSKKEAPRWGFKWQGVERDWYGPGQDALVFYMTPNECRFRKHGQQQSTGTDRSDRIDQSAGRREPAYA